MRFHNCHWYKIWIKKWGAFRNWPLLKNAQFLFYYHETCWKWITQEEIIYTKFHEDKTKCRFFSNGQILNVSRFFIQTLNSISDGAIVMTPLHYLFEIRVKTINTLKWKLRYFQMIFANLNPGWLGIVKIYFFSPNSSTKFWTIQVFVVNLCIQLCWWI